jgi:ABC-2 type transport system ATP-binding protein
MYVRLGFAVAIHAEPEILLVDEVLAVGDLGFQMKCYRRMHALQERGTTIVVISHNLTALQRICDQILVLDKGKPITLAEPSDAIAKFHALLEAEPTTEAEAVAAGQRFVPGVVRIASVELLGPGGERVSQVETGTPVTVRMTTEAEQSLADVTVGFALTDAQGQLVYTDTTANRNLGPVAEGQRIAFTLDVPASLPTGSYNVTALVQQRDLRALFAQSRPIPFYVTGRVTVGGAADLGGVITRHDLDEDTGSSLEADDPSLASGALDDFGEPAVPRASS